MLRMLDPHIFASITVELKVTAEAAEKASNRKGRRDREETPPSFEVQSSDLLESGAIRSEVS